MAIGPSAGRRRSTIQLLVAASMKHDARFWIRGNTRTPAFVALAASALGILGFARIDPNVLCLLPALALAVPLLMRRFPGERMLAERVGARGTLRLRARSSSSCTGRAFTVAPHGGLLIGWALAVRPPPAPVPAS
jgi:hypothetical protein